MRLFEFHVYDSTPEDSYWGDLRVPAVTWEQAAVLAAEHIRANEVAPNGSIEEPFWLEAVEEVPAHV